MCCWRPSASRLRTSVAPRSAARRMWSSSTRVCRSGWWLSASSAAPMMAVSRLLKSCATPPTRWPSFSTSRLLASSASRRTCAVMSVMRSSRPPIEPSASRIRRQAISARRSGAGSASRNWAQRRRSPSRPESSAWMVCHAALRSSGAKISSAGAPRLRSTEGSSISRNESLLRATRPAVSISSSAAAAVSNKTRMAGSALAATLSNTLAGRGRNSRTRALFGFDSASAPASASPIMDWQLAGTSGTVAILTRRISN